MIGRPYHSDPGLNHGIPEEFQVLGYPILSVRSIPRDAKYLERFYKEDIEKGRCKSGLELNHVWPENYSVNSAQKVWAAGFAARHPNVVVLDLSSFKCGHDAPVYGLIDSIIETSKTPYAALHDIDANKPSGSIKIRVKTYAHALKLHEERLQDARKRRGELENALDRKRLELLTLRAEQLAARSQQGPRHRAADRRGEATASAPTRPAPHPIPEPVEAPKGLIQLRKKSAEGSLVAVPTTPPSEDSHEQTPRPSRTSAVSPVVDMDAELKAFEESERKRLGLDGKTEQWIEDMANLTFTKKEKAHINILVSGLTMAHDHFIEGALRGIGYNVQAIECPDVAALQYGKEFGNRGQCNPTYFTVGNLVKFLCTLRDKHGMTSQEIVQKYVFLTAGACGPCRFGMYVTEYRKALRDAGFDGFRVVLFQQTGGLSQATGEESGLEMTPKFFWALVKALVAGDVLNALGYRIRPYEVTAGDTDRAIEQCKKIIYAALENALEHPRRHLASASRCSRR